VAVDFVLDKFAAFSDSIINMESVETLKKTTFSGRRFTRRQLAGVQETVEAFPNLSPNELAFTLCEHLNWTTPNGKYKIHSCFKMLEQLEAQGIIRLPAKRKKRKPVHSSLTLKEPETSIETSLNELGPISLQLATTVEDRALWRSYVESHHYLGYKRPIGAHLFYFVVAEARQQKLGCLLFSAAAAWTLAPRDKWIGWDKKHREKCLPLVLSQNRFLIFPWVNVSNLATRVLGLAVNKVGEDWVHIYQYRPVLIETFVDPTRFSGTSYRAANWHYLGETQGRGHDPKHEKNKSRKMIFVYPLQKNWRQCLTEGHASTRTLKKRYRNDVRSSHSRTVGDEFVKLWERVVHILHKTAKEYDEKWRLRKRLIDSLILMLLIFRLVTSKKACSYGTTIDDLWDSCDRLNISLPQKSSIAPSSFCAARKKLDETIFKSVNRKIIDEYAPDASRYTWKGHRLFAVDGSKVNLPPKLVDYGYPIPSKNSHYPQGLLSCLYQLKSQLPFDFDLVSHANERKCATHHLDVLEKDDVVVYDRGYFSYVLLHQHCESGIHAIFRLQENSSLAIGEFFSSPQTDSVITIYPPQQRLSELSKQHPDLEITPRKIRLIKYEIDDSMFCLGTTLIEEPQRYLLQDLKDVYHARWGVEELYKVSKRIFVIEDFHAKTERGVKQEIFAHFALITMNRLFANQADIDLNPTDNSTPSSQIHRPSGKSTSSRVMQMIKTNFNNCIHVFTRSLEELLLLRARMETAVQRAFKYIAGRYQKIRPGRHFARKSMRPATKWLLAKEKRKKKQPKTSTAGVPA